MRNYADNSVDSAENRAKLFGPETAKASVLEAPKPSELNQRGVARRNAPQWIARIFAETNLARKGFV